MLLAIPALEAIFGQPIDGSEVSRTTKSAAKPFSAKRFLGPGDGPNGLQFLTLQERKERLPIY